MALEVIISSALIEENSAIRYCDVYNSNILKMRFNKKIKRAIKIIVVLDL